MKQDAILTAEFDHITRVYAQNNEDRARVSTYYLVTAGSIIAAVLSYDPDASDTKLVNIAFAILFLILSVTGLLVLLQLVKLRQAWLESVSAMNRIKDYYVDYFANEPTVDKDPKGKEGLLQAFLWRSSRWGEEVEAFKLWSLSTLLAIQAAVLAGATLGVSVVFFLSAENGFQDWMLSTAVILGSLFSLFLLYIYRVLLLRKDSKPG